MRKTRGSPSGIVQRGRARAPWRRRRGAPPGTSPSRRAGWRVAMSSASKSSIGDTPEPVDERRPVGQRREQRLGAGAMRRAAQLVHAQEHDEVRVVGRERRQVRRLRRRQRLRRRRLRPPWRPRVLTAASAVCRRLLGSPRRSTGPVRSTARCAGRTSIGIGGASDDRRAPRRSSASSAAWPAVEITSGAISDARGPTPWVYTQSRPVGNWRPVTGSVSACRTRNSRIFAQVVRIAVDRAAARALLLRAVAVRRANEGEEHMDDKSSSNNSNEKKAHSCTRSSRSRAARRRCGCGSASPTSIRISRSTSTSTRSRTIASCRSAKRTCGRASPSSEARRPAAPEPTFDFGAGIQ